MCSYNKENVDFLYDTIISINSREQCEIFFSDLCTYKEINSMAQRLKAAKLLLAGETYENIIKETDISSATLSKVSKCVKYGNGYKNTLK